MKKLKKSTGLTVALLIYEFAANNMICLDNFLD